MRPVLLAMDGFGSFRDATVVDFTDADYFVLVGPTGAGKSTVIDAITFALYGSVPRWDNPHTVALALAPTINRGSVRFVFDVADARYVVARELRRAASGAVSVRGARLERLRDRSGTGAPDEDTEPLADGARQVTKAVEELLGLPFGDFCTCVVLPQGEFAEFLHTEPRKRQEKLVRILGLGVYDVIAREANSEAARQRQRAEVLAEQLAGFADATAAAEQAARDRVGELTALVTSVGKAVPELAGADSLLASATAAVRGLGEDRDRLAALAVPDGVAELDARRRAAVVAIEAAAARAAAAEAEDTAAREQLDAAPARGPLEQARHQHTEMATLTAELPAAQERRAKVGAAYESAAAEVRAAQEVVETARLQREAAASALATARDTVKRLAAERDRLRAVGVPPGLDAVDRRRFDAAAALQRAETERARAEAADSSARAALAAAPDRTPLDQARRDHRDLAAALDQLADAQRRVARARSVAAGAAQRSARARGHVDHTRERRAAALRSDLVAALRPSLVGGEPCPVCEQVLPEDAAPAATAQPELAAELESAERAVAAAEEEHERARADEATAAAAVAAAAAEQDRLAGAVERLRAELAGAFESVSAVDAAVAELDRLAADARAADEAARAARQARDGAAAELETAHAAAGAAASGLQAARDPLVPFGAPAVDSTNVLAGWTALVGWAGAEAVARDAALHDALAAEDAAAYTDETATERLRDAEEIAGRRRAEETTAARAEQEARTALGAVLVRLDTLRAALVSAPTDAEAAEQLERLDELEAAARTADVELRAARAAHRAAEAAAAESVREVAAGWGALRAARDPLVGLGAPTLDADADLVAGWAALTDWAGREAAAREVELVAAERAAAEAAEGRDRLERGLADDLAEHGIDVAPPLARNALPAAAAAAERARAARERVVERREQAARLAAERDEAAGAQQVAKMLGSLLRSDGFPRWLVASALDTLVADASRSLAELSGGQFELTHADGEFLVVDHADADARRPVKTLSGGETFQASLALALALSAQMSGLAAHGAARLESIFLDEGFGTLDETNLEVVAATLETLATHGERVVGVITHVPALAERVPVRYTVIRDQRSSSVTRESG